MRPKTCRGAGRDPATGQRLTRADRADRGGSLPRPPLRYRTGMAMAPARIDKAAMQSFSSGGVRIAFVDVPPETGAADPVVLVHGFASNHAVNWVNTLWVQALTRASYRVIAL